MEFLPINSNEWLVRNGTNCRGFGGLQLKNILEDGRKAGSVWLQDSVG
jgi:hypothetical protein